MLLQADKRHSYNTQMEKQPDKEDCIIRNMSGGKRWGHGFGDLLGRVVVEEGLWGVKPWMSEGLLSPSDSHSEEPGEESEDGEEEE